MNLPAHECSLTIEHNPHKDVYETLSEWLSTDCADFESEESRRKCLDDGELWVMQWYPNTPIGFNRVAAPTLDDLLRYANAYATSDIP